MIYSAVFIFLIAARFALNGQATLQRQLYPIALCGLFVFTAFRLEVGCDWYGYYQHFMAQLDLNAQDALTRREPLWWLLVQSVGQMNLSYPWLNVAAAGIFFAGIDRLARQQPDPLAFLIFVYPVLILNMPMSGIRQAAAVGVLCFAFDAFIKGKPLRYLILVLVSGGFHASGMAFLLLLPLVGDTRPRARLAATFMLALPGVVFLGMGESAQLAIARYVNTGVDANGAQFRAGMLFLSTLLYFAVLQKPWRFQFSQDHKLATIGASMMLACLPLVLLSSVIADRFGYYLIPLQALIFARIPYLNIGLQRSVLAPAPYLALTALLVTWSVSSEHFHYCYLPYGNWLTGIPEFYQTPL